MTRRPVILVVDDEPQILRVMRASLPPRGYDVRTAPGGEEALDELAKEIGISRQAVYAALHRGIIPSIRIGKRFVLPRTAIAEWLRTAG